MLLYLRHGDDRGDDGYKHDRPLNDRGRKKTGKVAKRLIERHGHPDVVYVSPFRRALETLEAMSASFDREVMVHREPRIAQHLSENQRRDPQLSPETRAQITIEEDRRAFCQRVADHFDEVRRRSDSSIWCITHQSVIEEVADKLGVKIPANLDFLDHVVMFR